MKKILSRKIPLYLKIIIGMFAGIVIGFIGIRFGGGKFLTDWISPWGHIFIRLLQLIAIPLVFVSLVKGVIGIENISRLSRMGGRTIIIYILTTCVTVVFGLAVGLLVKPGKIVDRSELAGLEMQYQEVIEEKLVEAEHEESRGPLAFLEEIIPDNIFNSLSGNSNMLQIIFFALFFGIAALTVSKEKREPVVKIFDSLNDIILTMVDYIIKFAPWGVAALMAGLVVEFDGNGSVFSALAVYTATVICALLVLIFIFYPVLVRFFTDTPVREFMKKLYPVQLFAFTTSSSSATLPVTMDMVEKDLGVSQETASFVLLLGATINMDGTSCYQAIAIVFIAQVLGIDLSMQQIIVVTLMTILSSIGTPGIPGGSYVILAMVLTSVGVPPEGLALILGIDRPLDMLRTAVNVTGDATVSLIVDAKAGKWPVTA